MTALPQIVTVPFHGREILTARDGDAVVVIMKPLVESLGLTWRTQHERIQSHPLLSEGVRFTMTPSDSGLQQMLSLELSAFHGWLITLDTRRIDDAKRREMILRYQRESFQAIHDYWHHGEARNPRAGGLPDLRTIDQISKMIDRLKRETNPVPRQMYYRILESLCREWNIEPPALDEIGREAPPLPDLAAPFFAGFGLGHGFVRHRAALP